MQPLRVYFKSGCGRGKIQAPLLYDSQYVPFFQLDEDSKMFNVVGFVQAGTMVIVSKQESKVTGYSERTSWLVLLACL